MCSCSNYNCSHVESLEVPEEIEAPDLIVESAGFSESDVHEPSNQTLYGLILFFSGLAIGLLVPW